MSAPARAVTAVELVRDAIELLQRHGVAAETEVDVLSTVCEARRNRVDRLRERSDAVAGDELNRAEKLLEEFKARLEKAGEELALVISAQAELRAAEIPAKNPKWKPVPNSAAAEGLRRLHEELNRRIAEGAPTSSGAFPLATMKLFEHRKASLTALDAMGFRASGARRSMRP